MITTKIYQYDSSQESNGYRGTDYSKYVLQGAEITEDITQELDTAELTLCGLNTNKEFEPESKFIIDIIETNEFGGKCCCSNSSFLRCKRYCFSTNFK